MRLSKNNSNSLAPKQGIQTINGKLIASEEVGVEGIKTKLNDLTQNTQQNLNATQSSLNRIETLYQYVLATLIFSVLGIAIILIGMSFGRAECSTSRAINTNSMIFTQHDTEVS